jgi:NADPH2:quinone reductase
MRAWLLNAYDGVDTMRLAGVPDPKPAAGEVVLRTLFAGLNPADAFLALNQYPAKPKFPHVLGRDGVGEVLELGEGVTGFKPGDRVGILRGATGVDLWGTLAEKVTIEASHLVPIPSGWTLEETAGAPLVYLTAWQALTQWTEPAAPPAPGSVLLITGASGGVGSACVLLGRSLGLTVIGLTRSAKKAEELKALGADFVFDPAARDLRKQVLTSIAPRRVDIVVDMVAGPLFNDLIGLLGYGGRISVVGRSAGPVPEFNTASLFFRRNRIGGVTVSDYSAAEAQQHWQEIVRRLDALGKKPVVDGVFEFEDVKKAFARLAEGPMGKVLVRVGA